MAFHYIGPLSRTPDVRACMDTVDTAEVATWAETNCAPCRSTLLGMTIEPLSAGGERMVVRWAGHAGLGIEVEDSDFGIEPLPYAQFDVNWRVAP
jgi:hypothetical protein